MSDDQDKAAIQARVVKLAHRSGLWRRGLAAQLGEGFRQLFKIQPGATDEAVRVVIIPKFIQMINAAPDKDGKGFVRLAGLLCFNLTNNVKDTSYLKVPKYSGLTKRQSWLDEGFRYDNELPPIEPKRGRTSIRDYDALVVYKHIADTLFGEWKQSFPDIPFPVENAATEVEADPADDDTEDVAQVLEVVELQPPPSIATVAYSNSSGTDRHRLRSTLIASLCAILLVPIAASSGPSNEPPALPALGAENPLGNTLTVQLQSVSSVDPSAGIAFSADDADTASYYTDEGMVGLLGNDYNKALQGGAYLVSGARVEVKLSAKGGQQADIYKIRPIKMDSGEPVATGLAIRPLGTAVPQGQFAESLGFNLDEQTPLAHNYENGSIEGLALDESGIVVAKDLPQELNMNFVGYEHSYSFMIEIEYTVNGVRYSQVVSLGGKPFRMSPDICVTEAGKYKLTETEVQALASLRYQDALVPDDRAGATPHSYTDKPGGVFSDSCQ